MPSDLAAERGEPSYVWRSGQERRLHMVEKWAKLKDSTILEVGNGIGTYSAQFRRRYTPYVEAIEIEADRAKIAQQETPHTIVAVAEHLPYPANRFDLVFSNEVIEHVQDDRAAALEMVRVTRSGGRIILFCPNRWWLFETHGFYWRGVYHFGNIPLINYLPNFLRNRLAPHVRVYTGHSLSALFAGQSVRVVEHGRVYPGFDNIMRRYPRAGKFVRGILYAIEATPLRVFGLSHFLVLEKI